MHFQMLLGDTNKCSLWGWEGEVAKNLGMQFPRKELNSEFVAFNFPMFRGYGRMKLK